MSIIAWQASLNMSTRLIVVEDLAARGVVDTSLHRVLFGAQLNSEIEHQTARDSTVRGERPLGARGAVMADTVGKAQ